MLLLGEKISVYRINEVAREVDRTTLTIKRLEGLGVLPPAKRDKRNWRYYTNQDLQQIKEIIRRRAQRIQEVQGIK